MTVSELIEKLKQYPMDLQVRNYSDELTIEIVEEYYEGDSANPDCKVIKALAIS